MRGTYVTYRINALLKHQTKVPGLYDLPIMYADLKHDRFVYQTWFEIGRLTDIEVSRVGYSHLGIVRECNA